MTGQDKKLENTQREPLPAGNSAGAMTLVSLGASVLLHAGAFFALFELQPARAVDGGAQEIPIEIVVEAGESQPAASAIPPPPAEASKAAPSPPAIEPQPAPEIAATQPAPPQAEPQPSTAPATEAEGQAAPIPSSMSRLDDPLPEIQPPQTEVSKAAPSAPAEEPQPAPEIAATQPAPPQAEPLRPSTPLSTESEGQAAPIPSSVAVPDPPPPKAAPPIALVAPPQYSERREDSAARLKLEEQMRRKHEEAEAKERKQAEAKKETAAQRRNKAEIAIHRREAALENPVQVSPPPRAASARGSSDLVDYRNAVVRHLQAFKRYPEGAQARGVHGQAVVSFTLDNMGHVAAAHIQHSSGQADIDAETLAMVHRASPFPAPPAAAQRSFSVAIEFHLE